MPGASTKPKPPPGLQLTFLVNSSNKAFRFVGHTELNDGRVQRQIRINAGRHVARQKVKQKYEQQHEQEYKTGYDWQEQLSNTALEDEHWVDEGVADLSPITPSTHKGWEGQYVNGSKQSRARKGAKDQIPKNKTHNPDPQSHDLTTCFSNVINLVGSAVNPFDTLPAHCSAMDKFLLHQCMHFPVPSLLPPNGEADFSVLPERLYGIRASAPFNPQRDLIFPQSYRHPAIFQWVLVSVSSFYTKMGGTLDPAYTARARSSAYRLINEGLSDPTQHKSDELLGAITSAVMVESRYGDPAVTGVHLEGLRTFLDRRGGVQSLVGKSWYPNVVQACHLSGSGLGAIATARDVAELRQQTEALVATLLRLQRFDLRYQRARMECRQGELERRVLLAVTRQARQPERSDLFKRYAEMRRVAFSTGSPLFTILQGMYTKYAYLPYVLQHCLLAVLLSLNLAVLDYSNDLLGGMDFLRKLVDRLNTNGLFVKGQIVANIETLNLFLVAGGLDGEEGVWSQVEFERKWMVIDAMRVVKRLGRETRDRVLQVLYGFLVGEDGARVDEVVLESVRREALEGLKIP